VDTVQGTLGQALLVLVGLAVLLFAVILVLVETDYLLGRLEKLRRRWRATRPGPMTPGPPNRSQREAERRGDGRGAP
jgi:hypothetical protein